MKIPLRVRLKMAFSLIFNPTGFYQFMFEQRMRSMGDLRAQLNRERRRKLMKRGKPIAK